MSVHGPVFRVKSIHLSTTHINSSGLPEDSSCDWICDRLWTSGVLTQPVSVCKTELLRPNRPQLITPVFIPLTIRQVNPLHMQVRSYELRLGFCQRTWSSLSAKRHKPVARRQASALVSGTAKWCPARDLLWLLVDQTTPPDRKDRLTVTAACVWVCGQGFLPVKVCHESLAYFLNPLGCLLVALGQTFLEVVSVCVWQGSCLVNVQSPPGKMAQVCSQHASIYSGGHLHQAKKKNTHTKRRLRVARAKSTYRPWEDKHNFWPKPTSTALWPTVSAAQSLSAGNPSVWLSISLGKSPQRARERQRRGRGGDVEAGQSNIKVFNTSFSVPADSIHCQC